VADDRLDPDLDELPEAVVDTRRRVSLVWLIPIVTLLAAAWLVYHNWQERGPLVTILFDTAEGLEAGRTPVNFKDVEIGLVESIALTPDLKQVLVSARLDTGIGRHLTDQTRFWVVRPRVSGSGVSGLETVFGGSFIAADLATEGAPTTSFVGLESPPSVSASAAGRSFGLVARELGSLRVGSPVYYLGIEIGQIVDVAINEEGQVDLQVFVEAPHDGLVGDRTRFWNVSGLSIRADSSGVTLSTGSLASVLLGGIAFANGDAADGGEGGGYRLYPDRTAAFAPRIAGDQAWELDFGGSLRGLAPGAEVAFRGMPIGVVEAIDIRIAADQSSAEAPVRIVIDPDAIDRALASPVDADVPAWRATWDGLVANGLRAQLKNANLLTGALYVDLDFYPGVAAASIDWSGDVPSLPTVPSPLDELRGLLARIGELPVEDIAVELQESLRMLRTTLDATDGLLRRLDATTANEINRTLAQTHELLVGLERLLKPTAPLQLEARRALREFGDAARSLRIMADYLERHPEALLRGKTDGAVD
jgi:paraquat-inducible protein B